MKCDRCDKPAVVHEVTVKGGVKKEVHLCEEHANKAGFELPGEMPIKQLLTQFSISTTVDKPSVKSRVCSNCGLSFARFRQHSLLGCPDCYSAFEEQLSPLIERAQSGATHHAGKTPRRAGGSIDRQRLLSQLLRELEEAVSAEQYERAAELRDRMSDLDAEIRGTQPVASRRAAAPDSADTTTPES